ncbi:hypothetical protein BKA70DRAFT_1223222 [Coprinopsis sp. MPI-PUGE-AT-0042]|nr:hypothetical protein BKA70DRAFT_1223222 [Coprinopsis sp. MPI-PUGE-AT-0042]
MAEDLAKAVSIVTADIRNRRGGGGGGTMRFSELAKESQKDTQGEAKQEILEDRAEVAADPALAGCTSFAVKTDYLRSQTNEYEIYANNKELSYVLVTDQVHVAQRTWVVGFILEQLVMTKLLHARLEIWKAPGPDIPPPLAKEAESSEADWAISTSKCSVKLAARL